MKKKSSQITNLKAATDFLYSFINLEKDTTWFFKQGYRLDRMKFLLSLFNNPEKDLKIIHIAGSKGKGSTAVLMAAVLKAVGYKTGLYTSPHIQTILERISLDLKPIKEKDFVKLVAKVKQILENLSAEDMPGSTDPTFFELMTLVAFLAFKQANCDFVVLETGLGGRLDATNVVKPVASVLTPIELEHTEILGNALKKIAREKCGIIKKHIPVFCAVQKPESKKEIIKIAKKQKASLFFLDQELERLNTNISLKGTDFYFKLKGHSPQKLHTPLIGDFQAENAVLCFLCFQKLFPDIQEYHFKKGFNIAHLKGRMELISGNPPFFIDGAHTPHSIERVLFCFLQLFNKKGILVFAAVTGKNIKEMAKILASHFQYIIISTPGSFKQSDPEQVFTIFSKLHKSVFLEKNPQKALQKAFKLSQRTLPVLATGSFYFVSEIFKLRSDLIKKNLFSPYNP